MEIQPAGRNGIRSVIISSHLSTSICLPQILDNRIRQLSTAYRSFHRLHRKRRKPLVARCQTNCHLHLKRNLEFRKTQCQCPRYPLYPNASVPDILYVSILTSKTFVIMWDHISADPNFQICFLRRW